MRAALNTLKLTLALRELQNWYFTCKSLRKTQSLGLAKLNFSRSDRLAEAAGRYPPTESS